MAAHCSRVVLMSTVAVMIRVSVYTSSLVHCETTFVWFVSAEADCRGAWGCFVTNHVIASVHGTVQVKTADSPTVTLTLNGPPNAVSEDLRQC